MLVAGGSLHLGLSFDSIDVRIRYNDQLGTPGIAGMKVWHHDYINGWQEITGGSYTIDTGNKWLEFSATSFSFYAIAEDATGGVGQPGGVVPEPAGLGLIGLALLAIRRRRS